MLLSQRAWGVCLALLAHPRLHTTPPTLKIVRTILRASSVPIDLAAALTIKDPTLLPDIPPGSPSKHLRLYVQLAAEAIRQHSAELCDRYYGKGDLAALVEALNRGWFHLPWVQDALLGLFASALKSRQSEEYADLAVDVVFLELLRKGSGGEPRGARTQPSSRDPMARAIRRAVKRIRQRVRQSYARGADRALATDAAVSDFQQRARMSAARVEAVVRAVEAAEKTPALPTPPKSRR